MSEGPVTEQDTKPPPIIGSPESAAWFRAELDQLGMTQTGLTKWLARRGDDRKPGTILRHVQRMANGEARVSGEMRVILGMMRHGRAKAVKRQTMKARVELEAAVAAHVLRFGERLVAREFQGEPAALKALAVLIHEAVEHGKPLGEAEAWRCLGMDPPPPWVDEEEAVPEMVDELNEAIRAHVTAFGEGPPVYQFMGRPTELAALIREAVARGKPLDEAEVWRRFGMDPPPPGVVL